MVAGVHDINLVQNIHELFITKGFQSVKLRHMGDNFMLLTPLDGLEMKEIVKGPEDWLKEV